MRHSVPMQIAGLMHVVSGHAAADSLREAGAKDLIVLDDRLPLGPCSLDDEWHSERRRAYWESFYAGHRVAERGRTEELSTNGDEVRKRLAALSSDTRVILWSTPAWPDRLALYAGLHAVVGAALRVQQVLVCEPPGARTTLIELAAMGLRAWKPSDFSAAMSHAVQVDWSFVGAGAGLWQTYTALNPLTFDSLRRSSSSHFPDLEQSTRPFGEWFPRREPSGRLRLAPFDQRLLDALDSHRAITPHEALYQTTAGRAFIDEALTSFGADIWARRLREWAELRPDAVDRIPRPDGEWNPFLDAAYRLSRGGVALRDEGLDRIDQAPPIAIGGCTRYDREDPWARRDDEGGGFTIGRP